jgi:hypothetical protein
MSDPARTGYTPLILLILGRRPMTLPELTGCARRWAERIPAPCLPGGVRDAVEELVRAGLVDRAPGPEPDTDAAYRVSDPAGAPAAARSALRALLHTPTWRLSDFPVAISVLPLLHPSEALTDLERRRSQLRQAMTELGPRPDDEHAQPTEGPGADPGQVRAYLHAMAGAEVDWLTHLIRHLHAGRADWSPSSLITSVARLDRPDRGSGS